MSSGVYSWWIFLCAVAIANVTAWSMASNALDRRGCTLPADVYHARRWQIILAAGYVFGCAYRSVLPVFDVPRFCLFDTWFSSAIVGRSVATFAELCFAAQWALLMRELSLASGSRFGKVVANSIVPLIAVAETFSWHAVLTTANAGHVVEETLWGVGATLVLAGLVAHWPHCKRESRPMLAAICAVAAVYAAYLFLVDVPMYWSRWVADEASGRTYFSVAEGFRDASSRWVVSGQWDVWKSEVLWMSMYFSVAVWISIALTYLPPLKEFLAGGEATSPFRDDARASGNLRAA